MLRQASTIRILMVMAILLIFGGAMPALVHSAETTFPEPGHTYRVIGVAANDRLNVRTNAGTGADIVGSLSPAATKILVTGASQKIGSSIWWEVIVSGAARDTGWINSRFVTSELTGAAAWSEAQSNYALTCAGNEPFWSLSINGNRAQYSLFDEGDRLFSASPWVNARGRAPGSQFAIGLRDQSNDGFVVVVRPHGASCSDGMSDIAHPFYGTLVLPDGAILGGCCRRAAQ